jgi:hypothetical protein
MDLPGADSAATLTRNRTLPMDPSDPAAGSVNVTCGTADYVCGKHGGPTYSAWGGKFAGAGSQGHPNRSRAVNDSHFPYSHQSDQFSYRNGASGDAIRMFAPGQLPVKSALAREFGVFNKLFSSVPSFSIPNHMFMQSATSCGTADNIMWSQCGGPNETFPQMTIYDALHLANKSFGFYINSTMPTACKNYPKTCNHGRHIPDEPVLGDANYPDVSMDGVARYPNRFFGYDTFYEQAQNGSLPHFSWVAPNNSYSDHPCNDVAKGERLTKDIYEALRAGRKWNTTLFAVIYDDIGGMYDHVVPPYAASDDAPCNVGNRPGPGPPPSPAWFYSQPLRSGRHPLYAGRGSRLLSEAERAAGMSGRVPPWTQTSSSNTLRSVSSPQLDGQLIVMRDATHETFVGFACTAAPPGVHSTSRQQWIRAEYSQLYSAMAFEFHEVSSSPAGRVYKLRNRWPAGKPKWACAPTGWVTYSSSEPSKTELRWFHANGTEDEAALVLVEATAKEGRYVLRSLGKANDARQANAPYISFHKDSQWMCCNGYDATTATPVDLMQSTPTPAPPPYHPAHTPCAKNFDFRRLGGRVAGMLISPWIRRGSVFQEPSGPYPDSQFDLSSMSTTIKYLFDIPGFLTHRDAWAGSFHELLTLNESRQDAPLHLPNAPPSIEQHGRRRHLALQDTEVQPVHCSMNAGPTSACSADTRSVTSKQRNQMRFFASILRRDVPTESELASLDNTPRVAASTWIHRQWQEWVTHPRDQ